GPTRRAGHRQRWAVLAALVIRPGSGRLQPTIPCARVNTRGQPRAEGLSAARASCARIASSDRVAADSCSARVVAEHGCAMLARRAQGAAGRNEAGLREAAYGCRLASPTSEDCRVISIC